MDSGRETLGYFRMSISLQGRRSQQGFYFLSELSGSFLVLAEDELCI